MVALVSTVAYLGLEARAVEVQCQVAPGMPRFTLVGLPDKAVGESRERVHAALAAMGLSLPPKRITINLSPADLPKEGSHYDLPIALALLAAMGVTDAEQLGDWIAVGELALDGRIVALARRAARRAPRQRARSKGLICPAAQGSRGALGERRAGARRARPGQPAQPPQGHAAPARAAAGRGRASRAAAPTSSRSRARKPPSARSRSPPPAGTTC